MLPHVNISKLFPAPYDAFRAFDEQTRQAAEAAGLPTAVAALVKIRVSALNGCAFCLRTHTRDAVAEGETADRLAVLPAWWESQYFTEQERAALWLAERVTMIGDEHTSPAPTPDGLDALSEQQKAAVIWLTIATNGWNRIAVASHYPVAP